MFYTKFWVFWSYGSLSVLLLGLIRFYGFGLIIGVGGLFLGTGIQLIYGRVLCGSFILGSVVDFNSV